MKYLHLIRAALLRRKTRTFLTLLSVIVPVSVTAFGQAAMQDLDITSIQDNTRLTPGLTRFTQAPL